MKRIGIDFCYTKLARITFLLRKGAIMPQQNSDTRQQQGKSEFTKGNKQNESNQNLNSSDQINDRTEQSVPPSTDYNQEKHWVNDQKTEKNQMATGGSAQKESNSDESRFSKQPTPAGGEVDHSDEDIETDYESFEIPMETQWSRTQDKDTSRH